ncbi:MAG: chorismate synthase [Parachlamydiales bacterium]|jgi:chorismate synthase
MASNSFGTVFKITTWGESHGKAIGVVIDGCPAGLEICEDDINEALALRAPGKSSYTSPRKESDKAEILSGTFEGKTTGTPLSIIIPNHDADPSKYEPIKDMLRPGHANFTYLEKYGIFDHLGGGRASARETACRVAAGAVAKKLLQHYNIHIAAYVKQIGEIETATYQGCTQALIKATYQSPIYCYDSQAVEAMTAALEKAKEEGDSLGGIVEFIVHPLPAGLGDPIYQKLEANLAHALMSLPASKGFEIGSGFSAAAMNGSDHNDHYAIENDKVITTSNHAGGTLGGISTGMPLIGKVAFKPTSSIKIPQPTLTKSNENASFQLPPGSRHDPCVAIRAVPIVEAMVAIVLADAILLNRCSRL